MQAFCGCLRALACALALLLLAGSAGQAESLQDALAGFAKDSFSDTEAAIGASARSGDPRAQAVIEALQDGRLLFHPETKKIYIKEDSGRLVEEARGQGEHGAAAQQSQTWSHPQ